tara:strand:+ start:1128 stop:1337 length:210 start_codon:yes stop_codon:yes gene_type:complete
LNDDITPEEKEIFQKFMKDISNGNKLCKHCFLETHLRAFIEVMADEPDQYIKMSTIYHNLKTILGDEDE